MMDPVLAIDADAFRRSFPQRPFRIRHSLCDHPLFDLARLVALSQALPADSVEYNAGDLPLSQDPTKTPGNGLSIEDTVRRIETCSSWLVLKRVEADPEYRRLLLDCLAEISRFSDESTPGMSEIEGFIFISSPNSVTPFHIDPEHSFLLQIRGSKQVTVFDQDDRDLVSEADLEAFYRGAHRNLVYCEEFANRGVMFALEPGQGLHLPVTAPHHVRNGTSVSVSFSVTFKSNVSRRRAALFHANSRLREWGMQPTPVGIDRWRDSSKYLLSRAVHLATRLVRLP
jgi:hypothetical protein